MRLLLTRSEPDAEASAARLRARGHSVLRAPMLEIAFLAPPPELGEPGAIALTSANGARAIAAWPQSRAWKQKRVFAVGDATAEAARIAGFTQIESAKGGSIELAALIARSTRPADGAVLFPAAETVAGDLAAALREDGFEVRQVTAYRATPIIRLAAPVRAAMADRKIDAILFYSERGAGTFTDIVKREALAGALADIRLLALSSQVARPLGGLSPSRTEVAAEPTEASLFALLASSD